MTVIVTSHDMAELEQLAGRIVLLHRGEIAFDGDFAELRRHFAGQRPLHARDRDGTAPTLTGAELVRSDAGRHEYIFDAARVDARRSCSKRPPRQTEVLDVETHRAPIDEVVADLYEHWLRNGTPR